MAKELEYAPAFILHTRPFKENQLLIEMLVAGEGRMSIIGFKGSKKNTAKTALFRPFRPLVIQFRKTSGLRTLKSVDENQSLARQLTELKGKALFCGFYINELICRLCKADEDYPELYALYTYALKYLAKTPEQLGSEGLWLELILRQFEYRLLVMLGYGISFQNECEHGVEIASGASYELRPDRGFVMTSDKPGSITGHQILSLAQRLDTTLDMVENPDSEVLKEDLRVAKGIMRLCLQVHLGDKPLKSRELFRK
ncbi:DNA repair protein RecO [Psychrosphaera ytuae]|uniref:DNA repair protein RecO n=1 Tax=Psychrosphaera ytuae TaxID=2820710 RepID=A0A975DDW7_9GAMM|nr:DNA repair protein RecO [Psychrosphaera ytuae]QTH65118.1 DNA repair protein RecO [Psychrosphaera ytuae]